MNKSPYNYDKRLLDVVMQGHLFTDTEKNSILVAATNKLRIFYLSSLIGLSSHFLCQMSPKKPVSQTSHDYSDLQLSQ